MSFLKKYKPALYGILVLAGVGLIFFGNSLQFNASSFLFKKLSAVKALFSFPVLTFNYEAQGGHEENGDFLKAEVIFRPPEIAYDQLIVARGLKDGVREGQIVLFGENIIIGFVGEVFEESSRVVSFSSFGGEHNVFLEEAGVSASSVGHGNGELRVFLPRDFPVFAGDRVFSLTSARYVVGFVEEIVSSPSAPLKVLKIKQPFNVYNLYSVSILK